MTRLAGRLHPSGDRDSDRATFELCRVILWRDVSMYVWSSFGVTRDVERKIVADTLSTDKGRHFLVHR